MYGKVEMLLNFELCNFWSEIIVVISNFEITSRITDQIPLHPILLHFEKKTKFKRDLNRMEVPVIFVIILHFLVLNQLCSTCYNLT